MTKLKKHVLMCLLLSAVAAAPAMADDVEEIRSLRDTTIALIKSLVDQGVLSQAKADELIRKAEEAGKHPGSQPSAVAANPAPGAPATAAPGAGSAVPATPGAPPVIRVPYVPESVKQEIRDEVKKEVVAEAKEERWGTPGALPSWMDRFTFSGDIRVRGQADRFPNDNVPNASPLVFQQPDFGAYNINNTEDQRNRLRLRVRFGTDVHVTDGVDVGIRLTSGTSGTGGDPSTENENLGNYNARGSIGFDRAFITYKPLSWLYFTGGRLGNPFFSPTTLVWGDDLSLQGVLVGFKPQFGPVQTFVTAGAFPIQDMDPSPFSSARSKWLYAYQAEGLWTVTSDLSLTLAGAWYDYRHVEGILNPTIVSTEFNNTAAPFRQKGNTVFDIDSLVNTYNGTQNYLIGLDSRFREANLSANIDWVPFWNKHVLVSADYVRNYGFNQQEIMTRTGLGPGDPRLQPKTIGMQERLGFGDVSYDRRNAWQVYVGYRRIERDAVVDAFTDADFHLGGTNAQGYYMGGRYAFAPNTTLGLRWYSAKQIDGPPLAIDVLQLDVIAAF